MNRRPLSLAIAAAAAGLAVVPTAMAEGPPDQSLLWSTTAPTATVVKAGSNYVITMPGSSPTTWFTDRPGRTAGTTTLQGFVGGWQTNEFDKVPPNAALVLRRNGETTQTVVVLTRPQELANGKIRFRAKVLPTGDVADMKTMNMKVPTGTFRNAALFIDAGDAPSCPAMITQPGWCTLSSSNYNSATTTVDLETPNKAQRTRTIQSCYWTGDHKLGARLYYADEPYDGGELSYTLDKTNAGACNPSSFSNLSQMSWSFAPVNSYYVSPPRVRATRNKRVTLTLNSRSASYGWSWRLYSTPKVVIVVSDS